ncbi:MAG: segregation/condensation protein A [Terriglobia bacterium]
MNPESVIDHYQIHLPVYEGPMDLLLDLIRKQQINIYDIPIALITDQYLQTLRSYKELDIDVAGEFLLMAAMLIHIKSKMLLPRDPLRSDEEYEDPRMELVQRLLEHEKFKTAAQMLHQKELVESSSYTQPGVSEAADSPEEIEIQVSLFDLVATFHQILERSKEKSRLEIDRDELTVSQVISTLRQIFERSSGTIQLTEIFGMYHHRRNLIVAFLAILEMVHLQAIKLVQRQTFSDILVRRRENFEQVMDQWEKWMEPQAVAKSVGSL